MGWRREDDVLEVDVIVRRSWWPLKRFPLHFCVIIYQVAFSSELEWDIFHMESVSNWDMRRLG
ncbi:unnamed protein product [Callosobruchus maculatus]|uniref:Uncharacterized protein n=1 Tax=Callosobruchus maculatus TaxID=64391 RepID=A0A653BJU1_CALMS|nr:unnamed protein product [Callosobruchus maculatus]